MRDTNGPKQDTSVFLVGGDVNKTRRFAFPKISVCKIVACPALKHNIDDVRHVATNALVHPARLHVRVRSGLSYPKLLLPESICHGSCAGVVPLHEVNVTDIPPFCNARQWRLIDSPVPTPGAVGRERLGAGRGSSCKMPGGPPQHERYRRAPIHCGLCASDGRELHAPNERSPQQKCTFLRPSGAQPLMLVSSAFSDD